MNVFNWLIVACWAVFLVFILAGSVRTKPTSRSPWWRSGGFRVGVLIVVILLVRVVGVGHLLAGFGGSKIEPPPVLSAAGSAICVAGLAFAAWGRLYLASNWGMPMSLRQGHELVTTGPYGYVRHPMYAGMLVAMLGSVLAGGLPWVGVIAFAAVGVYFFVSLRTEEGMMRKRFPRDYPAYQARTKVLVPFIL